MKQPTTTTSTLIGLKRHSVFFMLALATLITSCQKEPDDTGNPAPYQIGGDVQITSVKFYTQTECRVYFNTEPSTYTVQDLNTGRYTEGSGSPIVLKDLDKGEVYQFRIARGSESEGTIDYFSDKTDKILASTNAKGQLDRIKMLELVNQARSQSRTCGTDQMPAVSPVRWDDRLENAAVVHSVDMDKYSYMGHTSPTDGSTPPDRISEQQYNWRSYAENVARGSLTEESVMTLWLNSPPHCKNIMSPTINEIGAARAGDYWTQVFGKE